MRARSPSAAIRLNTRLWRTARNVSGQSDRSGRGLKAGLLRRDTEAAWDARKRDVEIRLHRTEASDRCEPKED